MRRTEEARRVPQEKGEERAGRINREGQKGEANLLPQKIIQGQPYQSQRTGIGKKNILIREEGKIKKGEN